MKNKKNVFGIIAIVAVFGFSMAACKNDSSSDAGSRYTSVDNNLIVYELEIGSKEGDAYKLTIKNPNDNTVKISKGTISSVSGDTYTLSSGGSAFNITISGGSMTAISGSIPTDGGTQTAPSSSLKPVNDGGDKSLDGTWKSIHDETVTFNGSNFTYKGDVTAPGTATYGSGILVTQGTYQGNDWVVAGNYSLSGNTIIFSGFRGTMATYFSGNWTKQ